LDKGLQGARQRGRVAIAPTKDAWMHKKVSPDAIVRGDLSKSAECHFHRMPFR
jgi:hypothetical protein